MGGGGGGAVASVRPAPAVALPPRVAQIEAVSLAGNAVPGCGASLALLLEQCGALTSLDLSRTCLTEADGALVLALPSSTASGSGGVVISADLRSSHTPLGALVLAAVASRHARDARRAAEAQRSTQGARLPEGWPAARHAPPAGASAEASIAAKPLQCVVLDVAAVPPEERGRLPAAVAAVEGAAPRPRRPEITRDCPRFTPRSLEMIGDELLDRGEIRKVMREVAKATAAEGASQTPLESRFSSSATLAPRRRPLSKAGGASRANGGASVSRRPTW